MKNQLIALLAGSISLALSATSLAGETGKTVTINDLKSGQSIGTIVVSNYDDDGVVFAPNLTGLTPGIHGFHIHQNGDCSAAMKDGEEVLGGAAGGHYDPENTNKHSVPWSEDGHEGDLPTLYVDIEGKADLPVFAPELELEDIEGRAIMIHANGDNYADSPKPLGGGGERVACGVIPKS
ncbi:superoxide dismutase family protein [Aliiglaciecola lipolytica]|uniref:Superoxide dismutase [Cu-Zn] n=1 Tax=Aliiglaciecola lipolytica E3 TaxID=1127673 RepID=K6X7F2_9ALTE|nr:superoxide dismutase family protein [Aliiglaciecola lipolytica]GAC16549.1 Cu/Zn superoxide dismutase [Aliiglaciecola lipolytica E3]